MNVRERLQALLDGKAIVEKANGRSTLPHRLRDDELEYVLFPHGWYRTITFERIFDPKVEFTIYEEPKPKPERTALARVNAVLNSVDREAAARECDLWNTLRMLAIEIDELSERLKEIMPTLSGA